MDIITTLGRTLPFAFASGINLYATVAVLGLCSRFELVALPDQFKAFAHPAVITVALVMYIAEFVADKIPWFDSLWDGVHTLIRPIGGAFVAVIALGHASASMQVLAALVGGSVATASHLTKAGARAAVNVSPEPFSNWLLSFGEDAFVVALSYFAITRPVLAISIVVVLLVAILAFASLVVRWARRRFTDQGRRTSQASS